MNISLLYGDGGSFTIYRKDEKTVKLKHRKKVRDTREILKNALNMSDFYKKSEKPP